MKCIILCGGFAKRLWPLTKDRAKPLLEVAEKNIINYVAEKIDCVSEIDKIIISTNARFEKDFTKWFENQKFSKPVSVIVESSRKEEEKLGAIGGINFVVENEKINDDLMVIAGDNIFGFDIEEFIAFYKKKASPVMAAFDIKSISKARLYGVIKVDENSRITDFQEKPEKPDSTLVSTACYIFPGKTLPFFKTYLSSGNSKDAPGFFMQWLHKKQDVHAFVFSNYWFDIGDFDSLEKADKFMRN